MLLTEDHARKVRRKRADLMLTKKATAERLGIKPQTLTKVEQGNYDAPRRIYESVINWLLEDV
ncbi:TPA: helix-turn-helix transcriptional regulator [Streptococcus suis]|uniref:Transcriptional regulator n=1 Tax=Streptococcus suis TaxID=1307 RepID=A0A116PQJ5_STRSU|nr:helix-turn-helix transcriptional regulator [Streptococcus suis]NQP75437.1 helix-turn-helix transcriptional regulator [Streptococcus suis]NQP77465.1 helix-turn-helix transcriptional regulator [Streptococcus suis]NQP91806.1 helix-turn-helix transcriptional regulator [Streptococcus suis]NQP93762.1 helix-turn-helix transcriptional regulator [Streptococcus suis]NQS63257.1 helix-turn-helix transcriptional regulator [Streptococcus suis]